MFRPRLERLEGRFAPAALSQFSSPAEAAQASVGFSEGRMPALAWPTPTADPGSADAVFSAGRTGDPLMSRIGRLQEQSLEFAPSGSGGGAIHADWSIVPATAPVSAAPSAEQVDELFLDPEGVVPEE